MPGIYFGNMEKQNSIDWLIEKLSRVLAKTDFTDKQNFYMIKYIEQAREMYNKEIEESYQDGKEIGTIETLLKNKQL
jgi:hypothetical protein